jgi:hypothetical protein
MSHENFKVGEIAMLQNFSRNAQFNGDECEIVALPRPCDWIDSEGIQTNAGYYVTKHHGKVWQTAPHRLRKRPPPREQTSAWDDVIVWRPKEMSHV